MQTFLPWPDFTESLATLDRQRAGKQRVEALQIIKALCLTDYGWQNHPAVKMWDGYLPALVQYYNISLLLWEERGYQNVKLTPIAIPDPIVMPWWFGENCFHQSHREALLWKNKEYYAPYFPQNKPRPDSYFWPNSERRVFYKSYRNFRFDVASYVGKN